MCRAIFIALLSLPLLVLAQSSPPPDLVPLPEFDESQPLEAAPPLPHDLGIDPDLEPQITIIKQDEHTVIEYRQNGELYMVKIIPRIGPPYYLVKNRGYGVDTHPGDAGTNVSAPMWKILEF